MRLFGYMAMDVEHMIHVLLQDTMQHNIVELPCPLFVYGKQWGRMVFYLMLCMPIPYASMVASCHLTAVATRTVRLLRYCIDKGLSVPMGLKLRERIMTFSQKPCLLVSSSQCLCQSHFSKKMPQSSVGSGAYFEKLDSFLVKAGGHDDVDLSAQQQRRCRDASSPSPSLFLRLSLVCPSSSILTFVPPASRCESSRPMILRK